MLSFIDTGGAVTSECNIISKRQLDEQDSRMHIHVARASCVPTSHPRHIYVITGQYGARCAQHTTPRAYHLNKTDLDSKCTRALI
jgi:hypothetical protein